MITNPKPMHPGQILNEVYMSEMGLNQSHFFWPDSHKRSYLVAMSFFS